MALATIAGMSTTYNPILLAPPGPIHGEAQRQGVLSFPFLSGRELVALLRPFFATSRRLAFIATGVTHSLAFLAWNALYRRQAAHLHLVHGGADDTQSYGRKQWLNRTHVAFVAVSAFVKARLVAHGVRRDRITIIENFLSTTQLSSYHQRGPFRRPGIARALVISRLDPLKRVDLLLDALDLAPALRTLPIRILGAGWDAEKLQARAARQHPNVSFVGFSADVASELAATDLLIHLCPLEPFGLAILEAMAAGAPVLAPDTGGAAALVEESVSGFHFRANDAADLAQRLRSLRLLPADRLNAVVAGGKHALTTRFAATERMADYQRLLTTQLAGHGEDRT